MSIYLHFLNPELYRSVGSKPDRLVSENTLKVLAAGTSLPLYSNYSNLFEGTLALTQGTFLRKMIEAQQIRIIGERASAQEFLDSRIGRYSFDRERYPMYFDARAPAFDAHPYLVKQSSSTTTIEKVLTKVANREAGISELRLVESDAKRIDSLIPTLKNSLKSRSGQALTLSFFSGTVDPKDSFLVARILSTLYLTHYIDEIHGDIATGYPHLAAFDHLAVEYPLYDLPALDALLTMSGLNVRQLSDLINDYLPNVRGTPTQYGFAKQIETILRTLANIGPSPMKFATALQQLRGLAPRIPTIIDPTTMFEEALDNIGQVLVQVKSRNMLFAEKFEEVESSMDDRTTILIITATDVETKALQAVHESLFGSFPSQFIKASNFVGKQYEGVGEYRIVHVQCEAGSAGQSNSQAVVTDAIREFKPGFVIMSGIAFGLKPDKQAIGEVLVSKMIVDYEKAKIKDGERLPRGQRVEAAPKLLSAFRAANNEGLSPVKTHFGTILSGEKLSNSRELVDELLKQEPEAVGGEMEGVGLVAAGQLEQTSWILVKAIVDWGFDKENNNEDSDQSRAASNAHEFVLRTLSEIGI